MHFEREKNSFECLRKHPVSHAGCFPVLRKRLGNALGLFHFLVLLFFAGPLMTLEAGIVREDASSLIYRQTDLSDVRLKKRPERTVIAYASLAPVWALAGGRAVGVQGVSDQRVLPESMRDLPVVGSSTTPNVEKILALRPDLVLLIGKLAKHRAMARLFRSSGVPAVCVDYNNYADFKQVLDFFCRLNGTDPKTVSGVRNLYAEVDAICGRAAGKKAPRCAIVFAAAIGFSLESSGTNTGLMASMLGAENVVGAKRFGRVKFSYEQLLLENPDVILIIPMGNQNVLNEKFNREIASQPAWKTMTAVKNNRVHFLPASLFLYMPGTRYPEAFRHLETLLYPEVTIP